MNDRIEIRLYRPGRDNEATKKQLRFIRGLMYEKNIMLPFDSIFDGRRKLSKSDASKIIDALLNGKEVEVKNLGKEDAEKKPEESVKEKKVGGLILNARGRKLILNPMNQDEGE